jgi:hypothetical protein
MVAESWPESRPYTDTPMSRNITRALTVKYIKMVSRMLIR